MLFTSAPQLCYSLLRFPLLRFPSPRFPPPRSPPPRFPRFICSNMKGNYEEKIEEAIKALEAGRIPHVRQAAHISEVAETTLRN